jgi:hypothetical protein
VTEKKSKRDIEKMIAERENERERERDKENEKIRKDVAVCERNKTRGIIVNQRWMSRKNY